MSPQASRLRTLLLPCKDGDAEASRGVSWLIYSSNKMSLKVYWEVLALAPCDTSNSKRTQKQQEPRRRQKWHLNNQHIGHKVLEILIKHFPYEKPTCIYCVFSEVLANGKLQVTI